MNKVIHNFQRKCTNCKTLILQGLEIRYKQFYQRNEVTIYFCSNDCENEFLGVVVAKKSKYNSKKCEYKGIKFDSKKEMKRYQELELLEQVGQIKGLRLQVEFVLIEKSQHERKVSYIADFTYTENGLEIVEDVKSKATKKNPTYIVKRKMFKDKYPNKIFKEVD